MSALHRYLGRLHDTILSRQETQIEELEIADRSDRPGQTSEFFARLRFLDDTELQVVEKLVVDRFTILKIRYAYNYRRADGELIFRYDNVAHYPDIRTFPHHKHVGNNVLPAQPPDLSEVLREIDGILYAS